MTRREVQNEIERLTASAPTRPSFAKLRDDRLAALRAMLPTLPADDPGDDPALARFFDNQRRAEKTQRAMERRGY